MIEYITMVTIPLMILFIILVAIKEKKDVYSLFISGAANGLKIVKNIFPYILGITVAIGVMKDTGTIDFIIKPFSNILIKFGVPENIVPIMVLRPLSGGASMAMAMEVFSESGPDSKSGNIVSLIMGATETTLYTMTVLYAAVKVKKTRGTLAAGLIADSVAIFSSIIIVNYFF